MFSLCSILGVLWWHALFLSLCTILSLFLCMVWRNFQTLLIYLCCPAFPTLIAWCTVLSSLYILASLVKKWITVSVSVYSGACYSVPLIYVSVLPIPCFFYYYLFVVLSEVWKSYSSSFILFPQNGFGNSGSFVVLYKF